MIDESYQTISNRKRNSIQLRGGRRDSWVNWKLQIIYREREWGKLSPQRPRVSYLQRRPAGWDWIAGVAVSGIEQKKELDSQGVYNGGERGSRSGWGPRVDAVVCAERVSEAWVRDKGGRESADLMHNFTSPSPCHRFLRRVKNFTRVPLFFFFFFALPSLYIVYCQ